jgi:hypothetical protein
LTINVSKNGKRTREPTPGGGCTPSYSLTFKKDILVHDDRKPSDGIGSFGPPKLESRVILRSAIGRNEDMSIIRLCATEISVSRGACDPEAAKF